MGGEEGSFSDSVRLDLVSLWRPRDDPVNDSRDISLGTVQ